MNYSELITWLLSEIDSDLLWAREASRRNDGVAVESGVHWQWETPDDQVVAPEPELAEFVGGPDGFTVSLRSREVFPTRHVGDLPQFAIPNAEEVPSAVGGHILRHDPARVIRDLTARRRSVLLCANNLALKLADAILRDMAETYCERPGYLPEWKPKGEGR